MSFFFSDLEASSGLSYVVPRTVLTWDFINNIGVPKVVCTLKTGFLLKGVDHAIPLTPIMLVIDKGNYRV